MSRLSALPLCLKDMKQHDLRLFIPLLIRQTCQRLNACYGRKSMRPVWWPNHITWENPRLMTYTDNENKQIDRTQLMQSIVKYCYTYYNQEHLLAGPQHLLAGPQRLLAGPQRSINSIRCDAGVSHTQSINITQLSTMFNQAVLSIPGGTPRTMLVPVAGGLQPNLTAAQPISGPVPLGPPIPNTAYSQSQSPKVTPTRQSTRRPMPRQHFGPTNMNRYRCPQCKTNFPSISLLKVHGNTCRGSDNGTQPRPQLYIRPYRPPKATVFRRPSKESYINALGLTNAQAVPRTPTTPSKVDIIDLSGDDEVPKTPRSARKSFMTQLSRDTSARQITSVTLTAEDSESDDLSEYVREPRQTGSLLSIDVTSLLGSRISDNVRSTMQESYPKNNNYALYCKTPIKNQFLDKLRHRQDDAFPYTFRPTRRMQSKYTHEYHMTRRRQREAYLHAVTGLDKSSRALKQKYRGCRVQITRLSQEVFDYYYIKPVEIPRRPVPAGFQHRYRAMPASMARRSYRDAIRYHYELLARRRRFNYEGSVKSAHLKEMESNKKMLIKHAVYDPNVPFTPTIVETHSLAPQHAIQAPPPARPALQQQPHMHQNRDLLAHIKQLQDQIQHQMRPPPTLTPPSTPPTLEQPIVVPLPYDDEPPVAPKFVPNILRHPPHRQPLPKAASQSADAICISSDEEDDSGARKPPAPNAESSGTSVFKCHLCGMQLICDADNPDFIRQHFFKEHNVECTMTEKRDANGQKVIAIVQKSVSKPSNPPNPPISNDRKEDVTRKLSFSSGSNSNQSKVKPNFAPSEDRVQQGLSTPTQNARNVPNDDVICID